MQPSFTASGPISLHSVADGFSPFVTVLSATELVTVRAPAPDAMNQYSTNTLALTVRLREHIPYFLYYDCFHSQVIQSNAAIHVHFPPL